jgi:hypothetical protein
MSVVICPGIHDPELTQSFWQGYEAKWTSDHHRYGLMTRIVQAEIY